MDSNISLLYWDCGKITRTNLFKKLFLSNCFAIFTNAWFRIAGYETHYSISMSKIETLCNLELFSDVISFLLIPPTTHIMRPRRKKVNLNTPYECTCTWRFSELHVCAWVQALNTLVKWHIHILTINRHKNSYVNLQFLKIILEKNDTCTLKKRKVMASLTVK